MLNSREFPEMENSNIFYNLDANIGNFLLKSQKQTLYFVILPPRNQMVALLMQHQNIR